MEFWPECHEFNPSAAEEPPCRGVDADLICRGSDVLPFGVVWNLFSLKNEQQHEIILSSSTFKISYQTHTAWNVSCGVFRKSTSPNLTSLAYPLLFEIRVEAAEAEWSWFRTRERKCCYRVGDSIPGAIKELSCRNAVMHVKSTEALNPPVHVGRMLGE
ncbi:hypothetical protein TNCV_3615341 [Trichonephila clavipes]|nr:hypothetical protein TNCV_3615341 [Trichonephila clavipes]